jgi:hypothetical protein
MKISPFFVTLLAIFSAQNAFSESWYEGNFKARIIEQGVVTEITTSCDAKGSCNLLLVSEASKNYPLKLNEPVKNTYSVELPNNNLNFTRRAVKSNPDQYNSKVHGAFLSQIKSLIDGDRKFTDCLDLKKSEQGSTLICSLSGKSAANEGPVLLMSTMNPTCVNQVFCAFLFVPLFRE